MRAARSAIFLSSPNIIFFVCLMKRLQRSRRQAHISLTFTYQYYRFERRVKSHKKREEKKTYDDSPILFHPLNLLSFFVSVCWSKIRSWVRGVNLEANSIGIVFSYTLWSSFFCLVEEKSSVRGCVREKCWSLAMMMISYEFSLLKRQSYYMRQPQILIFSCSVLCVYVHINLVHDSISAKGKMSWYLPARCIGAIKKEKSNERVWKLSMESKRWFLRIIIVKYFYQARTFFLFIIHHSFTWFAQSKFYFSSSHIAYASYRRRWNWNK